MRLGGKELRWRGTDKAVNGGRIEKGSKRCEKM